MGVEYYAINTQNKTFYDLGKGSWYALQDKESFQDLEYLINEILVEVYDIDDTDRWPDHISKDNIIKYVSARIGPDLFNMMKGTHPDNIFIITDSVDDIQICKAKKYSCIGTRYYEKDSNEYKEELERLNKHLPNNDLNKRWYNVADYTNYDYFDRY